MLSTRTLLSALLPVLSLAALQPQRRLFASGFISLPSSCTASTHPVGSKSLTVVHSHATRPRQPTYIRTTPQRLSRVPLSTSRLDAGAFSYLSHVYRQHVLCSSFTVADGRQHRGRPNMAASGLAGADAEVVERRVGGASRSRSLNWPLWYVLPIAPYQKRKTLMKEVVPGKVRQLRIMLEFGVFFL